MSFFTTCLVVSNVVGILSFGMDVYSDLALGLYWLNQGHKNWGIATLAFFFLPGSVNSFLGGVFAWKFFVGFFRYLAILLCLLLCAPIVSNIEWIIVTLTKHKLRWDVWQTSTGGVVEDSSVGNIGSISSRQKMIEVGLEAIPQIGLQLYIAAKLNSMGGLQLFTIITSIIGATMTTAWWLDDVIAKAFRKHLFDCSRPFRPALIIISMLWMLLALGAHLPAVAFFGAVSHGGALVLGLILYVEGFLAFLPLHLGKRGRSRKSRIIVGVPSVLAHLLFTGVVVALTQMWFIRVATFERFDQGAAQPQNVTQMQKVNLPDDIPAFIWPNPAWPMSAYKKRQMQLRDTEPPPSWAICGHKMENKSSIVVPNGHDKDYEDDSDEDSDDDLLSILKKFTRNKDQTCLTSEVVNLFHYIMIINLLFFLLQLLLLILLNAVDVRAVKVDF